MVARWIHTKPARLLINSYRRPPRHAGRDCGCAGVKGYSTEFASNALNAIRFSKLDRYAFVLLDLKMPGMTGFHLRGKVEIIDKGAALTRLIKKFQKRKIKLCTHEVIEAIKGRPGQQLRNFICFDPVLIYKIRITKIIGIQGFSEKGREPVRTTPA